MGAQHVGGCTKRHRQHQECHTVGLKSFCIFPDQCQQLSPIHEIMTCNWQQRNGELLGVESWETVKGDSAPPFCVFSLTPPTLQKNDPTVPVLWCFLLLRGWHACVSSGKFLWYCFTLCGIVRSFSFPPSPLPSPSKYITRPLSFGVIIRIEWLRESEASSRYPACVRGAGRLGRW